MCIICFLKDNYQYRLRKSAMLRSDRMEHTIDRYKYEFIDQFVKNKNNLCELHNNEKNRKIDKILMTINSKSIFEFFSMLREVYIYWIDAQICNSIDKLNKLLTIYNLLDCENKIQATTLFRGRKSKEFISHWDMFHIPFNKRYLIQNQRYSLTGQPILYLSTSPYSVIRELEDVEDIRISTFRIGELVSFKIYDNINNFNDIVFENNEEFTATESADFMLNTDIINNVEKILSYFFQMILASCCSFERREDTRKSSFSEEYVLSQVLTLVLKQLGFNGVKYISTKYYTDSSIVNLRNLVNTLYSNICIFTNYTEGQSEEVKNVYDRKLYNNFILSNPHKYSQDIPETKFLIEDSVKLIDRLLSDNISVYENEVIANIGNILTDYQEFLNMSCKDDKFKSSELLKSINLHSFLLRNIILNINENKLKNFEGGFRNE